MILKVCYFKCHFIGLFLVTSYRICDVGRNPSRRKKRNTVYLEHMVLSHAFKWNTRAHILYVYIPYWSASSMSVHISGGGRARCFHSDRDDRGVHHRPPSSRPRSRFYVPKESHTLIFYCSNYLLQIIITTLYVLSQSLSTKVEFLRCFI